jgi:hypothetical protein
MNGNSRNKIIKAGVFFGMAAGITFITIYLPFYSGIQNNKRVPGIGDQESADSSNHLVKKGSMWSEMDREIKKKAK